MRIFLFLGIILVCFGCQGEKTTNIQGKNPVAKLDSLSKEKIKLNLLKLSPEAERSLEIFEDFQNLRSFITVLRNGNSFYVNKHVDSIDLLVSTFKENLSEDLNINTINSRISVLSTETGLLKLLSEKKNKDSDMVMEANTRLIKAYNSLIIQLNELSLAIPENIEKELLRELEDQEKPPIK
ncbi:hypothetical protein [Aquimarina macrocephali]|uniref:hypothetical protein n=1 Tax=Aquimarina macrocephali TaxID=666563 RepID=UPI0004643764|nr:hypothetical protein [Aquimarina macrocephali]